MNFSAWALLISNILVITLIFVLNKFKTQKKLTVLFNCVFVCQLIWNSCLFLQILLAEPLHIQPIYFDYFTYIGVVFLPVFLYIASQVFTKPNFKIKKYHLLLFFIPILSLLIIWTNDFHHLFYKYYSIYMTEYVTGPYAMIHLLYTYSLLIISLVTLLKYSIKQRKKLSAQSTLFLLALAIPVIVNIIGILGLAEITIYYTPITFSFSFLLIFIAIFKFDFLNLNTIATQSIIKAITDSYLVLNRDNEITLCNRAFLDNFSIKEENLLNHNIFNIKEIQTEFSKDDLEICIELVKTTKKKISTEKYFKRIDKYFSIDISPILKNDTYIGTLIILKDVTEKEHDKLQIKANQDLLVEQERLASLGQMIGGIAHNLKTPIFSIAGGLEGLSDLIKEFDESIDDSEVTSQDMHDIAKDMNDWIIKLRDHVSYMSDVITTVKGQTVTMSESQNSRFTVKELFDHIVILMQHELKEKLTTLNISNNVPYNRSIYGNINSLVQVVNNLISNAIEAYLGTDKERIINLAANYSESNRNIIITIEDFGPGLPEKVQEKVFKEMITTKGKYGTGLGLFMSYSNIKAHFKGDLTFKTEKDKGTTFIISIPSR